MRQQGFLVKPFLVTQVKRLPVIHVDEIDKESLVKNLNKESFNKERLNKEPLLTLGCLWDPLCSQNNAEIETWLTSEREAR